VPGAEDRVYCTAKWSGTSFAAPRVAAAVAKLIHGGKDARAARSGAAAAFPVPKAAPRSSGPQAKAL
jgi:thermitase